MSAITGFLLSSGTTIVKIPPSEDEVLRLNVKMLMHQPPELFVALQPTGGPDASALMLAGSAMTQMPAAIATPEKAKVVTLHAEGAQIYEWRPRRRKSTRSSF
jgi:hypothetical protein